MTRRKTPFRAKPIELYAQGSSLMMKSRETAPGSFSMGGPIADCQNAQTARELARIVTDHYRRLAARRIVEDKFSRGKTR